MKLFIRAYASGGSGNPRNAASAAGQSQIERNMRRAGATTRQIRAAQRRAARIGGQVQTTRGLRG